MENLIKQTCADVFNTSPDNIVVVERLMGGMSNLMYKITYNDKYYTFRIPGKNAYQFVNRVIEKDNIELVRNLNINNNTIYLNVETGYKIAEYIDGTPLNEIHDGNHYHDAAVTLKRLHQSGLSAVNDYNPFERINHYEDINKELDYIYGSRYYEIKDKLLSFKDYLLSQPKIFCHGDSQLANFILTEDNQIYLLDWEFAGNNDYIYDIACFGNKNFNNALEMLDVYLGRNASNDELKRLYLWRAFQALQWHSVALYKHHIGLSAELHVDFLKVSDNYLNLCENLINHVLKELL